MREVQTALGRGRTTTPPSPSRYSRNSLAARGEHLLRTAVLLAGSRADGEDLLQAALERLFRRWRTIRGDPEGYLRREHHRPLLGAAAALRRE